MSPKDEPSEEASPTALVSEYLRLRDAGDPDAAKKVLARCHGYVRREVEQTIAVYEELEDIGGLARDDDPNQPGPIE